MGDIDRPRGLTQTELAEVLRRAAELDSDHALPVPADRLDPDVVEAAAIEAGLSPMAVRRAMHEVLHPDEAAPDMYSEGILPTRSLVVAREVAGTTAEVEAAVARFLERQLFTQERLFVDGSRWAPRKGWVAGMRRELDPGGRLTLKQVRSIAVTISPIEPANPDDEADEPSTMVRLTLDLSPVRSIHTAWLASGAAAGAGVIGGAGMAFGIDPVTLASIPLAGGLTTGGHLVGRRNVRRASEAIHTAVAGLLDRLEHPDRSVSARRRPRPSSSHRRRSTGSSSSSTTPSTDPNEDSP